MRGRRGSGASLWEERPPFYRCKRRRREGNDGRRNEETETKRTASSRRAAPFAFELHFRKKLFSFRVTFRIPVVSGKNLDIGSAHSRNPRHVMTRRGVARRAAEEERAWMSLLFSSSYMLGKNLPYKEVQLPLN